MASDLVLDARAMMTAAAADVGLSDWGKPDILEPLGILLDGLAKEGRLNALGRRFAKGRVELLLRNRLRMVEDRKRFPEISAQKIVRPMFLAGLPRAGTTLTHNLLSQSAGARSPRSWEMLMPSPAGPGDLENDPRVREVQEYLIEVGFIDKELDRIHPYDSRAPEECGWLLENALRSGVFHAFWRLPTYYEWLFRPENGPDIYRFEHEFLQHAQWRTKGDHWVLKWPNHTFFIPDLLAQFPDAIIIQNHRDPVRIIPSVTKLMAWLRGRFSDDVDVEELARANMRFQAEAMRRTTEARKDQTVDARFFDVHFSELNSDPMSVMERLYERFDMQMAEETRRKMQAYLTAHPRGRHGANDYSLEEYGLTNAEVDEAFGGYMDHYGVKYER